MPVRTRCWLTGVEIQRDDAWVLDRERAVAVRQDLAGRLAMLDQLLEQFGPVAGDVERAQQLGARPYHRRAVTGFVAKGYAAMFGDDAMFLRQPDDAKRNAQRQRELSLRHPWLGERVRVLTDEQWSDVRPRVHAARAGLNNRDVLQMRRMGLDVALALAGPGGDVAALQSWLDRSTPEQVLQALAPPERVRAHCLDILRMRAGKTLRIKEIQAEPQEPNVLAIDVAAAPDEASP